MARRESSVDLTMWLALSALVFCILLLTKTSGQVKNGKQECVPTRDARLLKSREIELRASASKLLQAFRSGNTAVFFGLVHPDYFGMAESKNYTLIELKKSFLAKEEMYCFLFDASCIPPPSPNDVGGSTSFSELTKRPEARVQTVEVWSGGGIEKPGCNGSVNFAWVDPVDPVYVSTFTFMYVGGQWKTVGFDLPPTAPPSYHKSRSVEKPGTPTK